MSRFELNKSLDILPDVCGRIFLAFSGGLDSSVLLDLVLRRNLSNEITLWHVNHGIQSNAINMQEFCQQQADLTGLKLKLSQLDLSSSISNLEAVSRELRYQLFAQELAKDDILLTAHHADDQLETFLLNMLRGSGPNGLRGIATERSLGKGQLIRPLLNISKFEIEKYAQKHQLKWVADPSNADENYSRNFLRHRVIPQLKSRWPECQTVVARACKLQVESSELINDLAAIDFGEMVDDERRIAITVLKKLSPSRLKNLLRYWLIQLQLKPLPYTKINSLLQQFDAKQDASPIIEHENYKLRIHGGFLYVIDAQTRTKPAELYQLDQQTQINVNEYIPLSTRAELFDHINQKDEGQRLSFRFRVDPAQPNVDKHKLKRLFQKYKIQPWNRPYTPQVYLDDQLVTLLL